MINDRLNQNSMALIFLQLSPFMFNLCTCLFKICFALLFFILSMWKLGVFPYLEFYDLFSSIKTLNFHKSNTVLSYKTRI